MTLHEAIIARHSVRQYLDKPIEAEKIQQLQTLIDSCNVSGKVHLQLVIDEPKAFTSGLATYGKFQNIKNYIAVVAPKGKAGDEAGGYYGEHVVLFAQTLGLNTVWVGLTFKNVKQAYTVEAGEELKAVIAVGYGATQGNPHPQKKTFADVAKATEPVPAWFRQGIDAALLAPTALNQQKFEFILHPDNTVEARALFALNSYAHIDLGIVKHHFELAAGKENFDWFKK